MKRQTQFFLLFVLLITVSIPLSTVKGPDDPLLLSSYSEENSPFSVPVNFTETSEYVKLDNGLVVEFYKEAYGYNRIYLRNGTVLVYNERVYLEYWAGSQWKPRGVPTHITWVQVSDTFYEVTRHYTDYLGTDYNVSYSVMSGQPIKMTVSLKSGPANEYKLAWELNGITQTAYSEFDNYTVFGDSQTDAWLGVDWEDVVYDWGDITTTSIEDSAQGKKLTLSFEIGMVGIGETILLDPTLLSSYSESNYNYLQDLTILHPSGLGSRVSAWGQTFTPGGDYALTSAKFYMNKAGLPTGTGYAKLYAMTGTYGSSGVPTGGVLATSAGFSVASLTGDLTLIEFTFSGEQQYEMQEGSYYCIIWINPTSGTIDLAKHPRIGIDNTGNHAGNVLYYTNGAWYAESDDDTIFYVYGEPVDNRVINGIESPASVNGVSGSFKVNGVG